MLDCTAEGIVQHTKVPVQDTDTAANEDDERNIAELLVDQIEFADVILLNKVDLVPDKAEKQAILAAISSLNPEAKVQFTTNCKVTDISYLVLSASSAQTCRQPAVTLLTQLMQHG